MKLFITALCALLLTACASFSPVVSVTTVAEPAPVVVTTVEAPAPAPIVTVPSIVIPAVEMEPPITQVALDPVQLECLALTLYHEARGEGEAGMIAVGYVVMNRVRTEHMGSTTICEVAKKSVVIKGKRLCQFTWHCDGISDKPKELLAYERAVDLAQQVMRGEARNPVGRSLYFHEARINWRYANKFKRVARIRNHIFYA